MAAQLLNESTDNPPQNPLKEALFKNEMLCMFKLRKSDWGF